MMSNHPHPHLVALAEQWRVPLTELEQIACGGRAAASVTYRKLRIRKLRRIARMLAEFGGTDAQIGYLQVALGDYASPWQRLRDGPDELNLIEEELESMVDMLSFAKSFFPDHPYPAIALSNRLLGEEFKLPDPYGDTCLIQDEIKGNPSR